MKKWLVCLLLCLALPAVCMAEMLPVSLVSHVSTDFGNEYLTQFSQRLVYDLHVDPPVSCVEYRVYELIDGQWQTHGPGKIVVQSDEGTIGFGFDAMDGTFSCMSSWKDSEVSAMGSTRHPVSEPEMACEITVGLMGENEADIGEEIPLAVQLISATEKPLTMYMLEEMTDPETLASLEWDRAFMLTLRFTEEILE